MTAPAAPPADAWSALFARLPRWRGVECQQFPSDLWRYAELIFEMRPPFVIETGTAAGGTARFLADVLTLAGGGRLITIDTEAMHLGTTHIDGNAASPAIAYGAQQLSGGGRGIVLLDDDHDAGHVLAELDLYAPLADYLVVEDTIMEHLPDYGHGPHEALAAWLPAHPEFAADADPSPTQHPGGWLRRVSG